jgi:acetoin utilization protein AcuB
MTTPLVELVMTRNPAVISPDDSLQVAIERMRERDCRRLPVIENGKLIGIVTDRDLRRATNSPFVMQERWYNEFILHQVPVRACMSRDPQTVSPSTPLVEAARLMRDRKIGGLPVVEGDNLVGIVTETDLFRYLIQILEG